MDITSNFDEDDELSHFSYPSDITSNYEPEKAFNKRTKNQIYINAHNSHKEYINSKCNEISSDESQLFKKIKRYDSIDQFPISSSNESSPEQAKINIKASEISIPSNILYLKNEIKELTSRVNKLEELIKNITKKKSYSDLQEIVSYTDKTTSKVKDDKNAILETTSNESDYDQFADI